MNSFNPADWYWKLADGRVYSSRVGAYVAAVPTGAEFTTIPVEQDLADVLGGLGLALPPGASLSDVERGRQIGKADRVILQIAFNHENRIRQLEGKAAITQAQFVNAIKTLL